MDKINVKLGFDKVPRKFTGEGENVSPPIIIDGAKGKSMAIIVDDPDCPTGTWVHWVVWNLPVTSSVPEAFPKEPKVTSPLPAVQGENTGDEIGYDGPYPPKGRGPHRYYFKVYVLDSMLELEPGRKRLDLVKAMEGKVVQYGEAMATFERK